MQDSGTAEPQGNTWAPIRERLALATLQIPVNSRCRKPIERSNSNEAGKTTGVKIQAKRKVLIHAPYLF